MASTGLLAADWAQTRSYITPTCQEANPIIGECGERVSPDVYFPVLIGLNLAASLLPEPWGELTWATVAGVQGATVYHNWYWR